METDNKQITKVIAYSLNFIYLFLAVLHLDCYVCGLSLVAVNRGYSPVMVCRFFIVATSLVEEH